MTVARYTRGMAIPEEAGAKHRSAAEPARLARDERGLFLRYHRHGEASAREELVRRFIPLARRLAARYTGLREPREDLEQVAYLGLLKALDRYDPDNGAAFSSYALPTMTGELRRHFRDRGWAVRPPRDLQERALSVERTSEELTNRLGRSPTVRELGQALELADEDVLEAMEAARAATATSLSSPRGSGDDEGDATLESAIGTDEHGFALAEDRAVVQQLARCLTDRERLILQLRFGEDLTQEAIGKRVGVSQMQVSRVLRQALAKLAAAACSS
jgi:RNA polymerase sigma-B factor